MTFTQSDCKNEFYYEIYELYDKKTDFFRFSHKFYN